MANNPKRLNPTGIANLKPVVKGEVRNKYGRKGKDGNGGFSLKESYRKFLSTLDEDAQNAVWTGLYIKATSGDVSAIKLFVEMNGEIVNEQVQVQDNGTRIIIQMPPKDDGIEGELL